MSSEPLEGEVVLAHQMYNQPKVSNADIWEALELEDGNVSAAARRLDMARNKLQERIDRSPELQVLMGDLREEAVDVAEVNTMKRAKSGSDPIAEKFVLQTLGKRRGWNTAAGGINGSGDITVTITRFAPGAIDDE